MERPFLRDCIFYLSAVFFVFCVFYQNYISLGHAIGFIVLYVGYVAVVIIARIINARFISKLFAFYFLHSGNWTPIIFKIKKIVTNIRQKKILLSILNTIPFPLPSKKVSSSKHRAKLQKQL